MPPRSGSAAPTARLVGDAPAPSGQHVRTSLLRGASTTARSWQAQRRLDEARAAAEAGRFDQAVLLLRGALAIAPRDPEISKLLGELAFRDHKRAP